MTRPDISNVIAQCSSIDALTFAARDEVTTAICELQLALPDLGGVMTLTADNENEAALKELVSTTTMHLAAILNALREIDESNARIKAETAKDGAQ